jgi:hypothetical protein
MEQNLIWTGQSRQFGPGVGFNWFDFLGMGGCYAHPPGYYALEDKCCPDLDDSRGWKVLLDELSSLRPGFLRFGIPPDPHTDDRGRFRGGTEHLERLERIAQWAEKAGCTILLDTFLVPSHYEMPEPPDESFYREGMYQMAAGDNRAYAREFVAPFLRHVVVERGLSAVRYFNPVNEPMCYGVYQTPGNEPDMYVHYVDMYREIRAALDDANIPRERLGLAGADSVEAENFPALEMLARGVDLDPYVDIYTLHFYLLRFDYLPQRPGICTTIPMQEGLDKHTAKVARYCHRRGKPLWATEFGSFYYGWRLGDPAGPATFDATLTVAEGVVRGLNIGLDAFAFWSLLNPNGIDGHWALLKIEGGQMIPTPHPYNVYGTLAHYCRPHSRIFPLRTTKSAADLAHLHGTALVAPDGAKTLLVVNDHPTEALPMTWTLPFELGSASVRLIHRNGISEETWGGGRKGMTLPPFSMACIHAP